MAATQFEAPDHGGYTARNVASLTNWIGAAVSLALIGGVGVWGYKLVMRDVSGIPVVQAAEGPMRVAPENPGGTLADHQGLAVNAIAGFGTAAPLANSVTLAPRPLELTDEDVASGVARSGSVDAVTPRADTRADDTLSLASITPTDAAPAPTTRAIPPVTPSDDPIQALADQIAAGVAPLSESGPADIPPVTALLDTDADADADPDAGTPLATFEPSVPVATPGVARSLRPQMRPADLSRTATLTPLAPTATTGTPELDPASLPSGTRVVQLGAFDSPETARAEWDKLDQRFGDYMAGKSRVIERASSGGRTFFRLRAHGFDDISDARRFCAAFVAERADCIPVVTR